MYKLILLFALYFVSCSSSEKPNETIANPIYRTAIKFSNEKTWWYDPAYYKISYPNGDVPSGGACTDVIIRVLRENGMDLQQLIHEDMLAHFDEYPHKWGLTAPDANIDHRRVPNIMKYFERMGYSKPTTYNLNDYKPGDIITWMLSPGTTHIGIYLENGDVYHNMGPQARIDRNFLFEHQIIGHYNIKKYDTRSI